jgi:S-adenosylmethionine:tRNA ribosyltransferase-isomerase
MHLSDFDFPLPPERIAQEPLADRAASRMLVVDRKAGTYQDRQFRDFPAFVHPRDCLVFNDSRVIPSRLFGTRAPGPDGRERSGRVEIFLVQQVSSDGLTWTALVRPGRKMLVGERIHITDELSVEILAHGEHGERTVRLSPRGDLFDVLERAGHVPLPPYIHRDYTQSDSAADRERYQTVYARERGSVAAPTAGLHFTPEILAACRERGAHIAHVTLHVGLGTFQPIHTENLDEVKLHSERFIVPRETLAAMDEAKAAGGRVIAVGTTSVRAIESSALPQYAGQAGETDIFISPGFRFRRTDAMLTNFHLPKSSLMMLVSALAGRELILEAYHHAVKSEYRFFSYGDCMLIL